MRVGLREQKGWEEEGDRDRRREIIEVIEGGRRKKGREGKDKRER